MPKYRVETNQGVFEVDSDREPTAGELEDLLNGGDGNGTQPQPEAEVDLKAQIRAQGPGQRTAYAAQPDPRVDKAAPQDAFGGAGKVIGAGAFRYVMPLVGSMGGPAGSAASAGGEAMAQAIEGRDDPGAVAKAGVVGAIPFSKVKGIIGALKNAGRMGAGNVAGTEAQSLVNDGKLADGATVLKDGAMGAAIPLAAGTVAKVAAKLPGVGRALGVVDADDAASKASDKLNNAEKDAVLARMKDRGAAVVPSSVNPSTKNKILESIAGIQNVEAGVARKNQPIYNAIGREEAKLPAAASINETNLAAGRGEIAKDSYDKARRYGFGPELDEWRSASTQLKEAEKKVQGAYTTARGQAVDDAEKALANAEAALTAKATAAGDPAALDVLKEAKTAFAKNYDVDKAVLSGTGDVRPSVLSGMLEQRGEAGMTDGLRDAAQFNNAFSRSAKNPSKMATAPGAASAGVGMLAGGGEPVKTAVMVGGLPMLRSSIRDYLTSDAYQKANAVRNYTPKVNADPRIIAGIIRELQMMGIARKKPEDDKK